MNQLEKRVFELKKEEEGLLKLKQEKEIRKAEKTVKFNNLKDYQISRFGEFLSEKTENFEELNIQFEKLSRRIENFGAINLLAIEECEEQEKRYNFLTEQKKDLEETINRTDCDMVLIATPIDLTRICNIKKPVLRVTYDLQEIGQPDLNVVLKDNGII